MNSSRSSFGDVLSSLKGRLSETAIWAFGLIALYFGAVTYGAIYSGMDMQMVILAYILAMLIAFILETAKKAIVVSSIVCLTIPIIWHLQATSIIAVDTSWRTQIFKGNSYEFIVMLIVIISVAWLGHREILRSLARVRAREQTVIAERDLLEIRVEERTAELKRIQAEKLSELYTFAEFGRLSAGIFHDISSPVTALSVSISNLQNSNRIYQIEDDLERIARASTKLGQLVGAVQKIVSRKEEKKEFLIADEIRDACDLVTYRMRTHEIELVLDTTHDICLCGNPLRFHQIILNLVSNAIDALEESNITHRTITIRTEKTKNTTQISVIDNGCGIPEHIIENIFNPFFTTKSAHKGTGIGLSQTKDIVEKEFSGTIKVSSRKGETIFTVLI